MQNSSQNGLLTYRIAAHGTTWAYFGNQLRYVNQFCGKHNVRDMDTISQMEHVAACLVGKRLMYKDLIA